MRCKSTSVPRGARVPGPPMPMVATRTLINMDGILIIRLKCWRANLRLRPLSLQNTSLLRRGDHCPCDFELETKWLRTSLRRSRLEVSDVFSKTHAVGALDPRTPGGVEVFYCHQPNCPRRVVPMFFFNFFKIQSIFGPNTPSVPGPGWSRPLVPQTTQAQTIRRQLG